MNLAAIEDALVAKGREVFGKSLRTIDHLPGFWGHDALRRLAQEAPALFFAFGGEKPDTRRGDELLRGTWHVYVFVGTANDEKQRRRGAPNVTGAYSIVDVVLGQFTGLPLAADALVLVGVDNLFDDTIFSHGLTAYRISYELLRARPSTATAEAALGEFLKLGAYEDEPLAAPNQADQLVTIRSTEESA
jgi:phage gp37-like protein